MPAITANSEHSPKGINGAFVASLKFDFGLMTFVSAKAAKIVAKSAKTTERDLNIVVRYSVGCLNVMSVTLRRKKFSFR